MNHKFITKNLRYLIFSIAVGAVCFMSASAVKALNGIAPSAKFDKVWVDYDVSEDGRDGMRIHTKFTVYGMKGMEGYQVIHFQTGDGENIKDNNKKYFDTAGDVALFKSLEPGYEPTVYNDLQVFMPYDELDLSEGEYDLKMDIDLIYKSGDLIQHMSFHDFNYKSNSTKKPANGSAPSARFDKTWVDYDVTQDGKTGMLIHVKFSLFNMKTVPSYLAIYFQRQNGDPIKTNSKSYASSGGDLAIYRELNPCCDTTDYEDLSLFMPYSELPLGRGSFNLQMDLDVIYKPNGLMQHLDFHKFVYKND